MAAGRNPKLHNNAEETSRHASNVCIISYVVEKYLKRLFQFAAQLLHVSFVQRVNAIKRGAADTLIYRIYHWR
jgi:hypothetical protein